MIFAGFILLPNKGSNISPYPVNKIQLNLTILNSVVSNTPLWKNNSVAVNAISQTLTGRCLEFQTVVSVVAWERKPMLEHLIERIFFIAVKNLTTSTK